jgi:hypothetical protein
MSWFAGGDAGEAVLPELREHPDRALELAGAREVAEVAEVRPEHRPWAGVAHDVLEHAAQPRDRCQAQHVELDRPDRRRHHQIGELGLAGEPLAAASPVDLIVNGLEYHTITDTHGNYRFFDTPKGAATLRVNKVTRPVQIGAKLGRADISL